MINLERLWGRVPDIVLDIEKIEQEVLAGLKDFQLATVNRIDELFRSGQKRVLVSDEVGLGKTLIARGAIAKLARLRREEGDNLVKVVYVCSNAVIADQNLNKLRISKEIKPDSTESSRLSMQHLKIFKQENDPDLLSRFVQLIPLTPDTSFRMTSGVGSVSERALMFALLRRIPDMEPFLKALEVAMKDKAYSAWDSWAREWEEKCVLDCDSSTNGKYLNWMLKEVRTRLVETYIEEKNYLCRLIKLCKSIEENNFEPVRENSAIGLLRVMFAQISVDLLKPDFVIMDEFQRFKFLIDSEAETETGLLAKRFFSGDDVRILMLSATPFKMYSTLEEIDDTHLDEHYSEFFNVMDFLNTNQDDRENFRKVWANYSVCLRELSNGKSTVLEAKTSAENAMYRSICRTERTAVGCADLIDATSAEKPLDTDVKDIKSFIEAQNLLDSINAGYKVPTDYIKSSPYLLSFMRDYKLKMDIDKYFKAHPDELKKADKSCLWLRPNQIENYDEKLDSCNARLELTIKKAFMNNAEKLLWVPPSMPYYDLGGPFKGIKEFSKMLIFSSWEMVPRMVASLVSYESERRIADELRKNEKEVKYYSSGKKRYPPARLNFSVSLGETKAMSLFSLIYPSESLADSFDPIVALNSGLTLKQIERNVRAQISERLSKLNFKKAFLGREDSRWYYLAPMLMDSKAYREKWLKGVSSLAKLEDENEDEKKKNGFVKHLQELEYLVSDQELRLGKRPDDLLDVLTDMAIASPAICMLRTYRAQSQETENIPADITSQVAKVFINRMNTTEATAVVERCYGKSDDAHWKNLLSYCKDGNLQAVFDEYAHILVESNGLNHSENKIQLLHGLIMESMSIRTAIYNIDTFSNLKKRVEGGKQSPFNMRSHFAVAFTKGDAKTDKDADRKKVIRNAFNSPFRPFVLATTSIGQEGLDFHYYCRKIVHWNLPSNPIDLEQREGRINRYKCLAIRQNVAKRYGRVQFENDIWNELFETA